MEKWVKQLKQERKGLTPKASTLTLEQIEIRELKIGSQSLKSAMKS